MNSWAVSLAKEFINRNNPVKLGPMIGVIISPLPDIKIKLLSGGAVITKEQIYLARNITNRLKIEATIKEFESTQNSYKNGNSNVSISTSGSGSTVTGGAVLSLSQSGTITTSSHQNEKENKANGKFILQTVFHLEEGMNVLVIPNIEEDKFFIIDVFDYAMEVDLSWEYYQK